MSTDDFDLERFLPFLLNRAAETASKSFSDIYKHRYGMTRGQWRVIANLGCYGPLTATEICRRGSVEKTKVSRAVHALEQKGWLTRESLAEDRRSEALSLTEAGQQVFRELGAAGEHYDAALRDRLGAEATDAVIRALQLLGDEDWQAGRG